MGSVSRINGLINWFTEAERRSGGRHPTCMYFISGTWCDFQSVAMTWDGARFEYCVTIGKNGWESFQLLVENDWRTTIYPSVTNANPSVSYELLGPDNNGHGKNWTIGRPSEKSEAKPARPSERYKISVDVDDQNRATSVKWRRIVAHADVEASVLFTKERVTEGQLKDVLSQHLRLAHKVHKHPQHPIPSAKATQHVALGEGTQETHVFAAPANGHLMPSLWRIINSVGVIVRVGKERSSEKIPERLAAGALVEQLAVAGDRLHFRKLSGSGPARGWITTELADKVLAVQVPSKEADLQMSTESNDDSAVSFADDFLLRWKNLQDAHAVLRHSDRRIRSWSSVLISSWGWLELMGLARQATVQNPFSFWVLCASDSVEGALARDGVFDNVNALSKTPCEIVLCGDGLSQTVELGPKPYSGVPRPYVRGLPLHSIADSAPEPDLVIVLMPAMTLHEDGQMSISSSFLPENPRQFFGSKSIVISTRFCCSSKELELLEERLKGRALFVMQRNMLSALHWNSCADFDDNGWITCVAGFEGLEILLTSRFTPPGRRAISEGACNPALFWGILDLKYDPNRPILERVQVLEAGDGRVSKFSNDGEIIVTHFNERYHLSELTYKGKAEAVCANKKLTHDLAKLCGYEHLLPRQACFPRVYASDLAARIGQELDLGPDGFVVLKLLNLNRGAGVVPVQASKLDEVLQTLLRPPMDLQQWLADQAATIQPQWGSFDEQARFWWSNECPHFVAERLCHSMPTLDAGKRYDGTMRVSFVLHRRSGQVIRPKPWAPSGRKPVLEALPESAELAVDWLGGYWKLPKVDMDAPELRSRVVSAARTGGTAAVDVTHLLEIYAALGDLVQQLLGGSEPRLDSQLLHNLYGRESSLASYFATQFAMFKRPPTLDWLDVAEGFLVACRDSSMKRCAESFLNRARGLVEAAALSRSWDSAQEWFHRSIENWPANAMSHYLLGVASLELGKTQRAADLLAHSLLLDPDYKPIYVNLGAAFLRLRRFDEAAAMSEALLERHPTAAQGHYHFGLACYQQLLALQAQLVVHRQGNHGSTETVEERELSKKFHKLRQRALNALSECRGEGSRSYPWLKKDELMLEALDGHSELPRVELPEAAGWLLMAWRK
eukprot:TRINITY_DN78363_c0_g1_i1.p1 TRINITY_DN78363_c0_g1~~TRINITY_DN78363_c0_g1_i1.p1  ORF type:complete len:1129 (-),score=148.74 TRINITY_DN78363_c0_g1_i1:7-3393(-)